MLVMAATTGSDALLTADEIAGMTLHAQLAILSACQSGLGAPAAAGILGLSRALIVAGVPAVVAALWDIRDEPTVTLMKFFYEALGPLDHGKRKAHALREAMLRTMAVHRDPNDWSGFILIGDPF